ncbi:TetR/AcrR family transcriptional regulator [Halopiger goleimassiliensis]|uniref:TetR/AcrR family transcriptional regulator n=1 Tax=Halopiger goleimassiliensis TaxID=1293048 RepID=UPI0009DB8D3E|nr:TetR/AcrR family transcriptional regulator [Halopiger goleimassiliensis]
MTDPDVRESIMNATYEALCEHGYTELTAQDIADRTDRSKSALFYHYDSKEELTVDFLEYLLTWLDDRVEETASLPPAERLLRVVDWFLYGEDTDQHESFHTAMLELRAQAPYNEQYREKLRKSDERLRTTFERILEDGIDEDQFVAHDTERMAALLIAALDGARTRQLTFDNDRYPEDVRAGIVGAIFEQLLTDEVATDRRLETAGETDDD